LRYRSTHPTFLHFLQGKIDMLQFLSNLLFNKYIWLVFFPLLIGWMLLADRLGNRTDKAMYYQYQSVKQIWGGKLAQPMPSVRYKLFGSDVSTLSKGEIHASDISVILKVDYRKKGLVYYTGYNAEFTGQYTIQNPENKNIYLSFIFPYPTQRGEGVLQNVKLLVNGKEDIDDTEYPPNLALWTGVLEPSKKLKIEVLYDGRGLDQFEYGFEQNKQINNFTMKVDVQGAKNLDYAESSMPPTEPLQETPQGKILVWKLDKALTQLNIGVILPDKLNVEEQLFVMTYRAPVFFLMFLISLGAILRLAGESLNFIQIAVTSLAYFLFYPLFAYLVISLGLVLAFIISFASIGLLILNYIRLLHGIKIALAVVTAYIFYLGITSLAALLPTYTGLILIIEGVILLGIFMQVLSQHKDIKIGELLGLTDQWESYQKSPRKTRENQWKAGHREVTDELPETSLTSQRERDMSKETKLKTEKDEPESIDESFQRNSSKESQLKSREESDESTGEFDEFRELASTEFGQDLSQKTKPKTEESK
jgi:hypothetical protein